MTERPMLEVLRPGALTTVQDHGRSGWAHLGVPRSGALDRPALDLANALVGNALGTAGLEITLTGCVLRFAGPATIAVTGATAMVTVEGRAAAQNHPLVVRSTETVSIGPARRGVRTYLGVQGGIAVAPVLGSRSTDTLSGLGPPPLRSGDRLPVGPSARHAGTAVQPLARVGEAAGGLEEDSRDRDPPVEAAAPTGEGDATGVVLGIRFGPRDDWFVEGAREVLCGRPYEVTIRSNRVGARLAGEPIVRANAAELPSEGLVLGAVQITPDGAPIVFLADHPTTGGYPVLGVVDPAGVTALAQVRPGVRVRFRAI